MDEYDLDRTDLGILDLLQRDARDTTTEEIGEQVGLAASTVASRIADLEDAGVIRDYRPTIDYERAGFDQRVLVFGTVGADDRADAVDEAMEVEGVVRVQGLTTEEENVLVEVVSASQAETEQRIEQLSRLGIEIARTEFVRREVARPFAHFGEQFTDRE